MEASALTTALQPIIRGFCDAVMKTIDKAPAKPVGDNTANADQITQQKADVLIKNLASEKIFLSVNDHAAYKAFITTVQETYRLKK